MSNSVLQNSFTVNGTVTNPTFSSILIQQVSYYAIGSRTRCSYRFGWQSGTAGTGEYLVSLPAGLAFNTAAGYNPTYTGTLWAPDVATMAYYLISVQGGLIQSGNWSSVGYVVPYDSTRFRVVLNSNSNASFLTWSSTWFGVTNGCLQMDFEIWQ